MDSNSLEAFEILEMTQRWDAPSKISTPPAILVIRAARLKALLIMKTPKAIVMTAIISDIHHLPYLLRERTKVSPRLIRPLIITRIPTIVGNSLTSSSGCRKITTPHMSITRARTSKNDFTADS